MKNLLASTLAVSLALSTAGFAGGPVVVVEEMEVVAEESGSSIGILPIILIGVLVCVAVCDNGDPTPG